jgi:predicted transcriptional regulator
MEYDMEYKIKNICNELNIGVSKFYNLKKILDNSIPEQNRTEYYYNKGRNFYITEKGFNWFKSNIENVNIRQSSTNNDISIYQNQIIEIYKQRIEYLENENKRLLDIISVKEQRELAKDVKKLGTNDNNGFFSKFIDKFKHNQ